MANGHGTLAVSPARDAADVSWIVEKWRFDRSYFMVGALVLILGFLVLYPIGAVVVNSLMPGSVFEGMGLTAWTSAFNQPGMVQSIINTFKVVATNNTIGLPIAIFIAWLLARTDLPFNRYLEFGFWILFFLPSLAVTTGWLLFFDADFGLANRWLKEFGLIEESMFNMYSFWGIVFAHLTTFSITVKVMLLTPAFRNIDGAIEEASRICGAGPFTTLFRVVIPIMAPAILVVFLMALIRGLESFELELFLGTPINFSVYSTQMFQLIANDPPSYAPAGVLATSILVIMLPLLVLQRWASTRRSYTVVTGRTSTTKLDLGRWKWPAFALVLGIISFMSLLPLSLLVVGSFMKLFGFFDLPELWTFEHWFEAFGDPTFISGFKNMMVLGLGTAFMAVFTYSLVAYATVRVKSKWQGPLDILTWMPLTVPGIILGFGYLFMVLQVPVFRPLFGTIIVMIFVSFLGAMTLGVQILKVHMLQIGAEVEEAGRVVGGTWARTFKSIITPLASPAIAIIAIMVFASTIRQVGSIILLSTGETRVLTILQLEFLTEGVLGPASVIGVVIVSISLIAAACVRIISSRFGIQARG